jgi:hypothetical protein
VLDKWSKLRQEGIPARDPSIVVPPSTYPSYPIRALGFSDYVPTEESYTSQMILPTKIGGYEEFAAALEASKNDTNHPQHLICMRTFKERDDQPLRYAGFVCVRPSDWKTQFIHEAGWDSFHKQVNLFSESNYELVWFNTYLSETNLRMFFGITQYIPSIRYKHYMTWYQNQADTNAFLDLKRKEPSNPLRLTDALTCIESASQC